MNTSDPIRPSSIDARSLVKRFPSIERLPDACWIVGGTLRDFCLGRNPVDVDVACRGAKEAAREFARATRGRVVALGAKRFTLIRVVVGGDSYDFAEIEGPDIETDLGRRDFTINAMAMHPRDGRFIDPWEGLSDLARRSLRMIDESNFDDDPLRLLRAVRFAATLDLAIEGRTLEAIASRTALLDSIAAERVSAELDLVLADSKVARGLELLHECGLDRILFGRATDETIIERLREVREPDDVVVLALLFLRDRPGLASCASRWRWSRARRDSVSALSSVVADLVETRPSDGDLAIRLHDAGEETARRSIPVLNAEGETELANAVESILEQRGRELFELEPLVSGDEIARATSIEPGPALGRLKRMVVEAQIRGVIRTREEALSFVVRMAGKA